MRAPNWALATITESDPSLGLQLGWAEDDGLYGYTVAVRGICMKTTPAVDIKGSQAGTEEGRQDFCGTGPRVIGIVCTRKDCVFPRDAIDHGCMCCYCVATLALSSLCGMKWGG